jgi:hypothetical protein
MYIETISKLLSHLTALSDLLPFICCLVYFKIFNKQLKILFIYICISILSNLIGLLSLKFPFLAIPDSYIFSIIETSIIFYLFYSEFKQPFYQKLIRFIYSVFISCSFASLIIKDIQFAEAVTLPLEFALIIFLSLIYFYKIFTDLTIPKLVSYPFFWFNSAFLIYFGTNIIIFLFYNYVKISNVYVIYLVSCVPLIMSIIYNSLLAFGICKMKRVLAS